MRVQRCAHLEGGSGFAEFPGWDNLPAVNDGRVCAVDTTSYFSRRAPRLIEGVEILTRVLRP